MTTRWKPDTCDCILEYDGINEDGSYVNPVIIQTCPDHEKLGLLAEQKFHRCKEDNQFKNRSIAALEELGHNPEEVGFAYDKDFILTLKLPSRISAAGRTTALSHIKGKFQKAQADRLKVE